LLAVKRAVAPPVDVCNRLMRFDLNLIPDDTRPYFRDVFDHVMRINEMVDNLRELLTTAFEVNLSLISVEENRDMKQLAEFAWSRTATPVGSRRGPPSSQCRPCLRVSTG
jgi:magnesium transporter